MLVVSLSVVGYVGWIRVRETSLDKRWFDTCLRKWTFSFHFIISFHFIFFHFIFSRRNTIQQYIRFNYNTSGPSVEKKKKKKEKKRAYKRGRMSKPVEASMSLHHCVRVFCTGSDCNPNFPIQKCVVPYGAFFWDYSVDSYSGIRITKHTEYQFPKEQTFWYSENRIADVTKMSGYANFARKDGWKLSKEHDHRLFCFNSVNSAIGNIHGILFRSFLNQNRSQKNTITVNSVYSHSGIVQKNAPLVCRCWISKHHYGKTVVVLFNWVQLTCLHRRGQDQTKRKVQNTKRHLVVQVRVNGMRN